MWKKHGVGTWNATQGRETIKTIKAVVGARVVNIRGRSSIMKVKVWISVNFSLEAKV